MMDPTSYITSRFKTLGILPNFIINKRGPDHKPEFMCSFFHKGETYVSDWFLTKKQAKKSLCATLMLHIDRFDSKPVINIQLPHSIRTQVFRHKSLGAPNNDALETLGDSVLNLIIVKHFFDKGLSPAQISLQKIALVNNEYLSMLSDKLGLSEHLNANCDITSGMKADLFEACVGGLFISNGLDYTTYYVLKNMGLVD